MKCRDQSVSKIKEKNLESPCSAPSLSRNPYGSIFDRVAPSGGGLREQLCLGIAPIRHSSYGTKIYLLQFSGRRS